jgi:glutamate N-acetyltransferase/amino-acid N-acetyltransferase
MAIGKTYFQIDEKKLKIKFGNYLLTKNGKVNSSINEKNLKSYLKKYKVSINVDLALGKESAKVITCDFSKKYIDINASYKS